MQPEQPVRRTTGSLIGDPAAAMPSRPPARRRPGASVITTSGRADRGDVYRLKSRRSVSGWHWGFAPLPVAVWERAEAGTAHGIVHRGRNLAALTDLRWF